MWMNLLLDIVGSFIGTVAFSIIFNVQSRFYFYCGITGMAGWVLYCALMPATGPVLATFLGTILVVLLSRIFAVWRKCPITVFLISGIFPLVPGVSVYYTAYYFVTNCFSLATEKGVMALKLAFAIVLGIVFIVPLPKHWFSIKYWKDRKAKKSIVTQ